ncbi:MAG: M18 family aminopeptidase, partial [Treponema sp.]|nr:M18 family aminopeptidase [Treponema sp.]
MPKNDSFLSALFDFIRTSPTSFHAIANVGRILSESGFTELSESEPWAIAPGGKYFVCRNGSALISFCLPESAPKAFMLCASHSDSPSFKIKENPERKEAGCVKLNVEKYGGMLIAPWFDRPLSVAGRIVFNDDGKIKEKLVCVDRDLLVIPNLAIHMNRDANDGHKIDVQKEIEPVLSLSENASLLSIVAEQASVPKEDILGHDLFLYARSEPCLWGAEEEFISAPRLDDLECAWTSLQGFIQAEKQKSIQVY